MRFLVLGSTVESWIACEVLGGITGVEKVWCLPVAGPRYAIASQAIFSPSDLRQLPSRPVDRIVLRDRWGKHLMGHKLEGYRTVKLPAEGLPVPSQVERLDPAVSLVRARRGEGGLVCQLSDGSELACTGVLFADGPRSKGRELMQQLARPGKVDSRSVAVWSFVRPDLLDLKAWEFRTALGKSVEQLPLPESMVRVKLRFRAPVGARQSIAELSSLFSEFGSDMQALFEGVDADSISTWEEETPNVAFSPLPGTLALGEAALGLPLLESFDWASRLCKRQLERMVESVITENWDPTAWEPYYHEAVKPLLDSERYLRSSLHYDNPLLRPLRDLAMRLVPSGMLVDRIKGRLSF